MSENTKFISRPKVRFFQFSDQKQKNEIVKESCNDDTNLATNGPKIRSIVTLKRPIRIVDSIRSTVRKKHFPLKDCEISACSHHKETENTQDTSLSNDNVPKAEVSRILRNANSRQNKKENNEILQQDKNVFTQNDTSKSHRKTLQQRDKENKDIILNKITSSKNIIKTRNCQYVQPVVCKKLKLSTGSNDAQKTDTVKLNRTDMTKSQSAASIMKKTEKQRTKTKSLNAKSTMSNVMPCYRYIQTGIMKNKGSSVKKIVLRSPTGPKIKTSVEPGVSRKQQEDAETDDTSKNYYTMSNTAVEKLAQPGYNSIMCTLNKLKEIKEQKIVRDINHLPPAQKNLLNGKVKSRNICIHILYIYIFFMNLKIFILSY